MTTPEHQRPVDTSGYVDLRPYDVSDQEVFETGLAALQLALPEWVPNEGNVETLILEAVALEVSEAVVALNRVPGAVTETLLLLAGVSKSYGTPPTATATVEVSDDTGHTIPGGTRVYVPTATGGNITIMVVEPPGLEILSGQTSGTVSLIGAVNTAMSNGVPAGTRVTMASPLPFVDAVTLATPVVDGVSPENDEAWRDRGVNRLSRLNETLVLPRHFVAAALEYPAVVRAVAVDNTDPAVAGSGNSPGHITVAVLGSGGAALSAAAKQVVEDGLSAQKLALLQVHVVDITITAVTLSVAVHLSDSTNPTSVVAAVRNAITSYINPMSWDYGATVRRNEIIALVDRVPGVDYVTTVTITGANGAGDLVLASPSAVPRATDASVTVTIV